MNNIDELLKQLPTEKTGVDFTAKVMMKVEALPARQHHIGAWSIIGICLGSLAVLGGSWWAANYFFEWNTLYIQPFLHNTARLFASTFDPIFRIKYSPMVVSGMLIGVLLLLVDAGVRRYISKHRNA